MKHKIWEYKAIDLTYSHDNELQKLLNDFGRNRWELASTTKLTENIIGDDRILFTFKRSIL